MNKKDKNKNTKKEVVSDWVVKRLRKDTNQKLVLAKAKMFVERATLVSIDKVVSDSLDLYIKKHNLN